MITRLGEINLLNIDDYAKNQYKRFIRGNWNDSDDIIQKKLTRNFILGYQINYDEELDYECRAYGNLYIYRKENKIVKIGCGHGKCTSRVYINTREKNNLNLLFEIEVTE